MATIFFAMNPEPGHINPTYRLARTLKSRGHRILYLGTTNYEDAIRSLGFEFIPLFSDLTPDQLYESGLFDASEAPLLKEEVSLAIVSNQIKEIGNLIQSHSPELFIVDSFLPFIALTAQVFGVQTLFLNTCLSEFDEYRESAMFDSLRRTPEMILCPQEFDFPKQDAGRRVRFFVEPSIDLERKEVAFPWNLISKHKPLIYCSLGTQTHFYKQESLHFYHCLIRAMEQRPDWQLVLSAGSHVDCGQLQADLPNVLVVNRAPQLEMLKRAAMMITHGGLGSIKECIFFGVPMIVFPVVRDQPRNAARVVYHRLGVRGNIKNVSVETIQMLIEKIDRDESFRSRVAAMSEKFKEKEKYCKGSRIIEKFLATVEKRKMIA